MPEKPDFHLKTGFFLRRPAEGGKGGVIWCDLLDLPGSILRTVSPELSNQMGGPF